MKKNVSLRKLKSKYGRNYTQKNEDFVKSIMMNEINKSLVKNKLPRNLKKGEALSAARLLINSCKRSVERVKNKSKVVYYGKQHDWVNDPSDMALFIAKDPDLITKWISTFMHYYDEGKPQNLRPTLERINSDIGYVKGNIDILAYKENVQNAAGIPCIALVSYEGVLTIFESISIEGIIERLNSVYNFHLCRSKFNGKTRDKLEHEAEDYSITIASKDILKYRMVLFDVKYDVFEANSDHLRSVKLPYIEEVENQFTAYINKQGVLEIAIPKSDTY